MSATIAHRNVRIDDIGIFYREAGPQDGQIVQKGDAVPSALKLEFAACFGRPLHEVFGTTETGLIAANWFGAERRIDSFGRAIPGVDVAVIDAEGNPACVGIVGEMIVRSPSNLAGYWNDPRATEAALKNGWFHTGDLVRRGSQGYLWFAGRKKEIIVRGGSNFSPQEVEAVLYQHPGVRDAGVVGVPDANWGERVVADVRLRPGHAVTAAALIAFVAERLGAYKTPEEIVFLDELPKSATGKVFRRGLRSS